MEDDELRTLIAELREGIRTSTRQVIRATAETVQEATLPLAEAIAERERVAEAERLAAAAQAASVHQRQTRITCLSRRGTQWPARPF